MSISPKYAVSSIMGYLKGKISLRLFQRYEKIGKRYWGRHLWSRGYCVSTIGLDEEQIRKYVRWQEGKDKEYIKAILTYLSFSVDRLADRNSSFCTWNSHASALNVSNTFGRQAIPMVWDYFMEKFN